MKPVSASELSAWLANEDRTPPVLLDVREPWETQICRIEGSELVPMQTLPARLHDLDPAHPIVCICHHGGRSAHVAMFLAHQGFKDVYNLTGGVDAWARQVDAAMPTY
ncbi:MAG TPA: rhodanese-like domain-containing protein [Burkholderiaceae bacterium]|nr:rhodanese-like domain-containing protein [Burkholderiaceae bacterium]